jgi:DNA polymerase III delta prime subunit
MNSNDREFLFSEKYRPHTITECILPEYLVKVFKGQLKKGQLQNLLLSGASGLGKTTVALALCEELGCTVKFIRASEDSGIDVIRTDVLNFAANGSFGASTKVVIFDEAERLSGATQEALRGTIEAFSANCRFIFTCNHKNRIIPALRASRLVEVDFAIPTEEGPKIASKFNKRVKEILDAESITYDDKVLAQVIMRYFPDFRKTLNELQAYANISDTIDEGILGKWSNIDMEDLLDSLKKKNFKSMRKWVVDNLDNDPLIIMRKVYDELVDATEQGPELVVILADYMYRQSFVADGEINVVALFTEIMNRITFKE